MSHGPWHYRIAARIAEGVNRIGDAWNWLVRPIERLFGWFGETMLGALDSFEGLETVVVGLVRTIFWPVIALGRLLGRLLPSGAGPLGLLGRALGPLFGWIPKLADRLNLDWLVVGFVWVTTPIWWPIGQLLGFANAWLATRLPRELALATPAIVLAVPFVYVAVQGAFLSQNEIAERYKVAVRHAVDAGHYQEVDLYERKLAQMDIDTRRGRFRTATRRADAGDKLTAYQGMLQLAPHERPGYPGAHLWIAQRLVAGEITEEMEPKLAEEEGVTRFGLAEKHLKHLETLEVTGTGIARLWGYLYFSTDRYDEAAKVLEPYATESLSACQMRLMVLANARRFGEAKDQSRVLIGLIEELRDGEVLRAADYEAWALAAELLRQPTQMEAALVRWMRADPENPKPRRLLATYRRDQTKRLLNNSQASPKRAAEIFSEAVSLGASSGWVTRQAQALATSTRESKYSQAVWEALENSPETAPTLIEAMGTGLAALGDYPPARELFARAIKSGKASPVAWNNYAWTMIQQPDPDPVKALELIEKSLQLLPDDHRFRETRGQIFIEMERWEEAVVDLEFALNGMPESSEIHSALAIAYDALSRPRLAEIHRQQASR